MLRVRTQDDTITIGRHFGITFQRTLRIPDDGGTYPLPPGLGAFPVRRVADYARRVPASWREHGGVMIPMYQREAMWLSFNVPSWRACAVKVGVGKVNAVSGQPWDDQLIPGRQDYVVCPDQPWLDGIKAGDGFIRQFVAMPLGMGYTVEGQVTGNEEFGGIQLLVYEPKPGRFPDQPPRSVRRGAAFAEELVMCCASSCEMGLGAGGRMRQKIYDDTYGIDTWDISNTGRVYVHIVNSMMYREITGEEPPPTPISARDYARHGLPWFDLYDEAKTDLPASQTLAGVKSIKEMDGVKGFASQQDDSTVEVPSNLVKKLEIPGDPTAVPDGKW
jgi:hypothetical protein